MALMESLGTMDPQTAMGVILGIALPQIQKHDQAQLKLGGGGQSGGGLGNMQQVAQLLPLLQQMFSGGVGGPPMPPQPPRYPAAAVSSAVPGGRPAGALPPAPQMPRLAPMSQVA